MFFVLWWDLARSGEEIDPAAQPLVRSLEPLSAHTFEELIGFAYRSKRRFDLQVANRIARRIDRNVYKVLWRQWKALGWRFPVAWPSNPIALLVPLIGLVGASDGAPSYTGKG